MNRRGMTLVEMLVALTATLLLMAAVAQAFSAFGGAISGSRSVLELDARMRSVAWRLRSDLAGVTARTLPPRPADAGEGYFEVIEGPVTDAAAAAGVAVGPADHDDVLLFTTRSAETPFVGRGPGINSAIADTLESTVAEVAWFARPTPNAADPVTYTLYRRQLLVMGYVGADPFHSGLGSNNAITVSASSGNLVVSATNPWTDFFNLPCDISVRREGNTLLPNTLADLNRRECRFLHNVNGVTSGTGFPWFFVAHQATPAPAGLVFDTAQRQGEDVVLTSVLSFDVRVFDPAAPVAVAGQTALVPGDPGFTNAAVGSGAYVDLGHGVATNALVSAQGVTPRFATSGTGSLAGARTYDTWTNHYEANGRDEDGDGSIDEGTNGIDDDGDGTVDDAGELETAPPYAWPLRGIEVRIRCYDPSSRQVRQVTVRHTFVPH